jgi:hypothetical protein
VFPAAGVFAATAMLVACGATTTRHIESGDSRSPSNETPGGPGVYRIDPSQSEIRVLVYRAGPMARLGHNHVIVNHGVVGWVRFTGNVADASFSLSVPAADFVVDDARAREQEGADFSDSVPEDAKLGTRRNMLSDAVLSGDKFPAITVSSIAVARRAGVVDATVRLNVAGHESTVVIPFTLDVEKTRILASGTITLRQTTLGLVPFSVFMGALQVQDELSIKFNLRAL